MKALLITIAAIALLYAIHLDYGLTNKYTVIGYTILNDKVIMYENDIHQGQDIVYVLAPAGNHRHIPIETIYTVPTYKRLFKVSQSGIIDHY